jgi:hypothetical protein
VGGSGADFFGDAGRDPTETFAALHRQRMLLESLAGSVDVASTRFAHTADGAGAGTPGWRSPAQRHFSGQLQGLQGELRRVRRELDDALTAVEHAIATLVAKP